MDQLKKWYELAYEKFKMKEEYSKKKTKQDFISDIKSHLESNIKDGKIIYEGKETDISNIKIEWNYRTQEKEDILKLNSLSVLISAITIFASMTTATFLSNTQIILAYKLIILLVLFAVFYIMLFGINIAEKCFNIDTNYDCSFYQVCLMVLEDLEKSDED